MPSEVEQAEAHVAVLRLEERLRALKADPGTDPDELERVKHDLRAARKEHRTLREQALPGAGVVRPATIEADAGVKRPGGGG